MEASWSQNRDLNRCLLQQAFFEKTSFSLRENHDFDGPGGPSWESKSIKARSRNGDQKERHLGMEFQRILVGLGSQVGRENRFQFA